MSTWCRYGGEPNSAERRLGRFDGRALTEVRDIFVADEAGTSRIAFGRDGMLSVTTTGRDPQDPNTQGGKVLRLKDRKHPERDDRPDEMVISLGRLA